MSETRIVVVGPANPRARAASAARAAARALERLEFRVDHTTTTDAVEAVDEHVEAVVVAATQSIVLPIARRLKARFQMPMLPIVALTAAPRHRPNGAAPDVWLRASTPAAEVADRVEELVRIRHAEREMARLSTTLAELAAENGRLYERARRDAEATALLLRELQHRVRNNLAAIQALLVLERHRVPPRELPEALDVAIARLRSMAALQDSLLPHASEVELASLARAVANGALDVFGAGDRVRCDVIGGATLPARSASAVAIVLNELITNALKHADARTVDVTIRQVANAVELDVTDDGRGMPTKSEGGSGLVIVRAVVQNELGGSLSYVPATRGTRARIAIPAASAGSGDSGDAVLGARAG
ncbi:MAG TPA: sensor histidine kinase [Gemmatimonadaceae bacterium]|nr:sensor histidine kinase [Gemmatimonadaceae bacterium]